MNLKANEVEFRLRGEWSNIIESLRLIEQTHVILSRKFYRTRREPGYYLYYVVARPRPMPLFIRRQ